MKFKLKYWYLATGTDGIPEEYPEKIVDADTKDEAFYKYHKSNGINVGTFDQFMAEPKYIRRWATSCEEILSSLQEDQVDLLLSVSEAKNLDQ